MLLRFQIVVIVRVALLLQECLVVFEGASLELVVGVLLLAAAVARAAEQAPGVVPAQAPAAVLIVALLLQNLLVLVAEELLGAVQLLHVVAS